MATNNKKNIRQSANLLPAFFRTEKNIKFLSSTIDQLIKAPSLERIDGFVGSKLSKNYNPKTDVYIPESLSTREKYQLEPALVMKELDSSIKAAYGFDDLINQVGYYGGNTNNLDRLFRPSFNAYDPRIDWDKFINFRNYYWLPNGPDAVTVAGLQKNIVSTYTVTDTADGNFFIFTPDGLTPDPLLTFYRGVTYVFNIKSKHTLFFKTTNIDGFEGQYTHNLTRTTIDKTTEQIIITIDSSTPSVLFYDAADNQLASGRILVKTILENSNINVDKEIIGKKSFKSANGVEFINGLKIRFVGNVTPDSYAGNDYIVEGIGDKIRLVDFSELTTPVNVNPTYNVNFDGTPFDEFPFDDFKNIPETPEYITINKASQDRNPWSRYNRWAHADVITASAVANNTTPVYPAAQRAARPIIEFRADMQLWNFGASAIPTVDFMDNMTTDAFSSVEGAYGYYVDGVQLEDGNTVIFNADPDPLVQGKVYQVGITKFLGDINYLALNHPEYTNRGNFNTNTPYQVNDIVVNPTTGKIYVALQYTVATTVTSQAGTTTTNYPLDDTNYWEVILPTQKIQLIEIEVPSVDDAVVIRLGTEYQGSAWWFDGTSWVYGQQRDTLNQAPLFDLYDLNKHSYSDKTYYDSQFFGNQIFGYTVGSGVSDPVLGFPLQYVSESISSVGSYQFTDYFNSGEIVLVGIADPIPTYKSYIKINHGQNTPEYVNVWTDAAEYNIPVLQFQVIESATSSIEITVFDKPASISDLAIAVFVNDVKQSADIAYKLITAGNKKYVTFTTALSPADRVLFKCYTVSSPNASGTYETPLNLTNNPLNGQITTFTLTDLTDHVKSMIDRDPAYDPSNGGNLKSLPDITKYGTRLITNHNPLSFAHCFITNAEHNLINATRKVATEYYQFKINLLKFISQVGGQLTPDQVVDQALSAMSQNKNSSFPYAHSDMVGYGNNNITSTYTVTDSRNKNYSITSVFSPTTLSDRSVLVYLIPVNGGMKHQLVYEEDYNFSLYDASVHITRDISKGDIIEIKDYFTTVGSYVPPTPTKLGLYPKYKPAIYVDTSYSNGPQKVIQGHDGSLTIAFSKPGEDNDYQDLALLEFETRIYNNVKVSYDPGLINIHDILPSVYRTQEYSYNEIYDVVQGDFIKWTTTYGLDFATNSTYDVNNHKTYNFKSVNMDGTQFPGNWRAIYKLYFDTDRPNTHPWEMLGFSNMPAWWEEEYGQAPYTAGNLNLWQDLEAGLIRQGSRAGVDPTYVRPGLSTVIPVDDSGNIIDVREWAGMDRVESILNTNQDWTFGDHGPTETAWRRSSLWPFAMQIIMALTKPADYAAMMFDTSRLKKDITGQYNYGVDEKFLAPADSKIFLDTDSSGNLVLASGYSVWVIEAGRQRAADYVTKLKQDLALLDFNLFYKAAGFLSKDKLEITIDSISPTTVNPGVLLPNEDYALHFNVSPPIKSAAISGIIIEKKNAQFAVRGYDKSNPYFTINSPIHQSSGAVVTVGGKSEIFLVWTQNSFYQRDQVVQYQSKFYRVTSSHNSGLSFTSTYYTALSTLPMVGGVSVLASAQFESAETVIPYGTRYSTIQEVYDLIVGYGNWLGTQGFIFDEFNQDLSQVMDWNFSGKEFLYWTTQNWSDTAVITVSPFADQIKYEFKDSVVDNVLDSFYEYSLLKANGQPFPLANFRLSREDSVCTITTKNTGDGLFFARLNLVQKEHAIIMNNTSMFNDVIYDIETGYRQSRIRLAGFRTADWNGEYLSPGFIYDDAQISDWSQYTDYTVSEVVKYVGNYYSAIGNIPGAAEFDFNSWNVLGSKPVAQLLPNFDYKINQFEDFYSLDIDNFDAAQQRMAQHLIGYTPRTYLDNIFVNPIAQYKFYQGFIREKGTRNAIDKLAKASIHNMQGQIDFREEWAFRVGSYGNFISYNELEFPLREADFRENSQIVKFVDTAPVLPNDVVSYIVPTDITIKSDTYTSDTAFITNVSTYEDNTLIMPIAGYVRTDDVTATAYNKNSILDIANNGNIQEGNTIWLGFREDGQWDVYRYTVQKTKVVDAAVTDPTREVTFTTDIFHNLTVGEIVSVYGLSNGADGVYLVKATPTLTTFTVASTLAVITASTTAALIYKFASVRVGQFDDIAALQKAISFRAGDLVWVDSDNAGKWNVYEKTDNYDTSTAISLGNIKQESLQKYGYRIATQDGATIVAVSSPNYLRSDNTTGRISVYTIINNALTYLTEYGIRDNDHPSAGSSISQFGSSLIYDTATDSIFAGAPGSGLVKVVGLTTGVVISLGILVGPDSGEYGSSLYLSKTSTTTSTDKILLVGSPNQTTGVVYAHSLSVTTSTIHNLTTASIVSPVPLDTNFGHAISGNDLGNRVVISSTSVNDATGAAYIYSAATGSTAYTLVQTLSSSLCKSNDKFGTSVLMSDDGTYTFVSSATVGDGKTNLGKVFVYKWNSVTGQYDENQILDNPGTDANLNFGYAMEIDSTGSVLAVSGKGDNNFVDVTFDTDSTTFDGTNCKFGDTAEGAGTVYIFNRYNDKFIYAEELFDNTILNLDSTGKPTANSGYGESIAINSASILVGAPGKIVSDQPLGGAYIFTKKDITTNSWTAYRTQDDLVDLSKVKRAITIDSVLQQTVDYLDIVDPAKGRIVGIADQEVRYKTAFDPAVYSLGVQGVVVDTTLSWIEEHLGELWWDLSTVKYTWYEQGDLEYRKNTWGTLFPGASIDVYEWVSSEYLPSQWSSLADTVDGLAKGISGQPKYPDNSVISVKQYYNATTGGTTNVYFYWVKNKVTIPDVDSRKISANEVARLIYNPAAYGTKYISVLDNSAIAVTNVTDTLSQNNVYLNIAKDDIDNTVNQHTEWLLLADGDPNSMPTAMLEKKLIDSLLGRDSLGNPVPDPKLSDRVKYGVSIRPRQGLFKDRIAALRNAIDYTNTVLTQYTVSDFVNFTTLNSKDSIPDLDSGEYDQLVDNDEGLYAIVTNYFITAALSCEVTNGRITNVTIDNPGAAYKIAPTVEVLGDASGAIIKTEIDTDGKIVKVNIVNPGQGFSTAPVLAVRPYTVIVTVDATSNNVWAKYQWTGTAWSKVHTQDFDTTKFWDYTDWKATSYDLSKPLAATVEETYLLATLDVSTGDYVKVKNQGNGRYIILSKVDSGGTFADAYDLIYSEKGTIRIKESLWNKTNSPFNFDNQYTFDQTLYDQDSEAELEKILQAIKEDIFVGVLKVYWNKFFFKAVRYAMSEQIFLDWAFKTSFINVRNIAGPLDQRAVYKFQNSQYYEDYLNEVKPFHTKIRNFQVDYSVVEPTQSYTTDFDLPAAYDKLTDTFIPIELGSPLLNEYPRKGWADNYKLSVESIVVATSGQGYTSTPKVTIIPAPGDVVTTATAIAYISRGTVLEVEVTNPGAGYTKTPTVVFTGGGPTDLTHATAYTRLVNGKVRANTVGIKFDRISGTREISNKQVTDEFLCPGNTYKFDLTWAAEYKKSNIEITLDGIGILGVDYTIVTYTKFTNGYNKLYSRLELAYVPTKNQLLVITYNKNIDLYSATDRIEDYYNPTDGMEGSVPSQLMHGIDYPGTQLQTLPFTYTSTWDMLPFTEALWDDDGNGEQALDTILDGGKLDYTNATGLNPEDIIVDGDAFISPNVSHGPEELVPGEVRESLALSVYTRVPGGSPIIMQSVIDVDNTLTSTTAPLAMLPPTIDSVMVSFNDRVMDYGTDYTLDINAKTITLSTQTSTGVAGVTIVGVGGTAFAASTSITVSNTTTVTITDGLPNIVNVGSIYATLNGKTLSSTATSLTRKGFVVNGLSSTITNTIQVWFFESAYKGYSEVKEQIFVTTAGTHYYTVSQYPGTIGPVSSQAIVELDKKRLTPPLVDYYSVTAGQLDFAIDANNNYPSGVFDLRSLQVFVNGIRIRNGIDFILNQSKKTISFQTGFLSTGDVIAISSSLYSDYYFENGSIYLTNRVAIPDGGILKVITYTNHDSDLMRTEVFIAGTSKRFKMNRQIFNDNYVWVSVDGNPLVNGYEYYIDRDRKTVVLDVSYPIDVKAKVVVTSMIDVADTTVIGYRIFRDILNRTTYKRLSEVNSTRLTVPLGIADTEIHVVDASVLSNPHPVNNIPGVVLIAGERIEFMTRAGNILSRIKRATLGTGARDVYPVDTQVIDQGLEQNMPYRETTNVNTTVTNSMVSSYIINDMTIKTGSSVTATMYTTSTTYVDSLGKNVTTSTNYEDLVTVYYGGIPLRKDGTYVQVTSVRYDDVESTILGTVSTATLLPATKIANTAYIVTTTTTNQVWVYTASDEVSAVNGYVYCGLNYLPPQYTITTSTTPNVYVLNLAIDNIPKGIIITLAQHTAQDWYNNPTVSLLNDNGTVATFLRDSQAALPDKYHYGQL